MCTVIKNGINILHVNSKNNTLHLSEEYPQYIINITEARQFAICCFINFRLDNYGHLVWNAAYVLKKADIEIRISMQISGDKNGDCVSVG